MEPHKSLNKLIATMKDAKVLETKKISDKYHTFGDLYRQRAYLFSVICNQNIEFAWKSKKHFDEENDPMFNGDFVAGITTPLGEVSYHFKLEFWDLFEDIEELDRAPYYDGYSPEDALVRIRSLIKR